MRKHAEEKLISLAKGLRDFRRRHGRRAHPPSTIWASAVALCKDISLPRVAAQLSVSENSLRNKRAADKKTGAPQFMELPPISEVLNRPPVLSIGSTPIGLELELERKDGGKLRIQNVGRDEAFVLSFVSRFMGESQ